MPEIFFTINVWRHSPYHLSDTMIYLDALGLEEGMTQRNNRPGHIFPGIWCVAFMTWVVIRGKIERGHGARQIDGGPVKI